MQHILEVCTFGICHESAPPLVYFHQCYLNMMFQKHAQQSMHMVVKLPKNLKHGAWCKFETWQYSRHAMI
jgi:hypothetical protein